MKKKESKKRKEGASILSGKKDRGVAFTNNQKGGVKGEKRGEVVNQCQTCWLQSAQNRGGVIKGVRSAKNER